MGTITKNPTKARERCIDLVILPTYVEVVDELLNDTMAFLNQDIVDGANPMWDGLFLGPEEQ